MQGCRSYGRKTSTTGAKGASSGSTHTKFDLCAGRNGDLMAMQAGDPLSHAIATSRAAARSPRSAPDLPELGGGGGGGGQGYDVWMIGALLMFDILYFIIFYYFMKIIDNI